MSCRTMAAGMWLALLLALASASQAFALSWTCPVCGQSFPFDSRDGGHMNSFASRHLAMHGGGSGGGSSGGGQTPVPPPPPDPLPGLRSNYQQVYRALQDAFGHYAADLPRYTHASSVAVLGQEVARCQAHVDAVIARFDGGSRSIRGELSGIQTALGDQRRAQEGMQGVLAQMRERVRLLELEAGVLDGRSRAIAERIAALKAKTREIEEASAPVRQRIFATLEDVRKAGFVRSPSGFAEWIRLPEVETRTTTWSRDPHAQPVAVQAVPAPARYVTPAAAAVAARPVVPAPANPQGIAAALAELAKTPARLKNAIATYDGLRAQRTQQAGTLAGSRSVTDQLRRASETLRQDAGRAEARVAEATARLREAVDEELARKHDLLRAAAAWSFWHAFDETVKPLATKLLSGNRVRAEVLVRWQAVMRDVMQLGQDVSVFLPRAADECAYAGEAAQRHYDTANERFALRALLDLTDTPTPWAHPFLKQPSEAE